MRRRLPLNTGPQRPSDPVPVEGVVRARSEVAEYAIAIRVAHKWDTNTGTDAERIVHIQTFTFAQFIFGKFSSR